MTNKKCAMCGIGKDLKFLKKAILHTEGNPVREKNIYGCGKCIRQNKIEVEGGD